MWGLKIYKQMKQLFDYIPCSSNGTIINALTAYVFIHMTLLENILQFILYIKCIHLCDTSFKRRPLNNFFTALIKSKKRRKKNCICIRIE